MWAQACLVLKSLSLPQFDSESLVKEQVSKLEPGCASRRGSGGRAGSAPAISLGMPSGLWRQPRNLMVSPQGRLRGLQGWAGDTEGE